MRYVTTGPKQIDQATFYLLTLVPFPAGAFSSLFSWIHAQCSSNMWCSHNWHIFCIHSFFLPLIIRGLLVHFPPPGEHIRDFQEYGFLIGTFPTAPGVFVFAKLYNIDVDMVSRQPGEELTAMWWNGRIWRIHVVRRRRGETLEFGLDEMGCRDDRSERQRTLGRADMYIVYDIPAPLSLLWATPLTAAPAVCPLSDGMDDTLTHLCVCRAVWSVERGQKILSVSLCHVTAICEGVLYWQAMDSHRETSGHGQYYLQKTPDRYYVSTIILQQMFLLIVK